MREQYFYGHGKLLLTCEYFVIDGAKSLALPTNVGQTLSVKNQASYDPKLYWKSYDYNGNVWFEASYELWRFKSFDNSSEESKVLQQILKVARKLNPHFLRDEVDIFVETHVEFPLKWGLGSSSSLIYNIAQWAYVSPFELASKTMGGSGYDIACAQSMGPITFERKNNIPKWESVRFDPIFKDKIFFVYLEKKQKTKDAVDYYKNLQIPNKNIVLENLSTISEKMLNCFDLKEFDQLIFEHENIVSSSLNLTKVQDELFSDYWGAIKSLGAWGGDFVMVTSDRSVQETKDYFNKRGYTTFINYDEIICQNSLLNINDGQEGLSTIDYAQ